MVRAHTILSPEQQNMEKRLSDCDGCHNPDNRPIYRMMVNIDAAYGGLVSQSIFMICGLCARKPIQLFLHGSGRCAPGIRVVDDARTLGNAGVETTGTSVVDEVVEPPVEVMGKPKRRRRARARKQDTVDCEFEDPPKAPPPALDPCANCGHQRGFHIRGPCKYDSVGRGCSCRGFVER